MHLSSIQAVALMTLALASASQAASSPHHVVRRSFFTNNCKGVNDAAIFARLDRICEDCFYDFREVWILSMCRHDCFSTDYFKVCVGQLNETDELELFKKYIKQLHGADP